MKREIDTVEVDDSCVKYNNLNYLLKVNFRESFDGSTNEDLLEFLDFLEERKNPIISLRNQTFPHSRRRFNIEHGLVNECSWPQKFRNFLIENENAVFLPNDESECGDDFFEIPLDDGKITVPKIHNLYSKQQKIVACKILECLYSNDEKFSTISISGSAGTGKTHIISILKKFNTRIIFSATSNLMCQTAAIKFGIESKTYFKFIMEALSENYYKTIKLNGMITMCDTGELEEYPQLPIDSFTLLNKLEITKQKKWVGLMEKHGILKRIYKKRIVFFFDECTQLSNSMLIFVKKMVKQLAHETNINTVLILAGDEKQIQPINTTIYHSPDLFLKSGDYEYRLLQQFRITDESFNQTLDKFCKIQEKGESIEFIQNTFKYIKKIEIYYPFGQCANIPDPSNFTESAQYIVDNPTLLENVFKTRILMYSNTEMHFYNQSVAVSIYNQAKMYGLASNKFVGFSVFRINKQNISYPIKKTEFEQNVHILPLIRFYPYKVLESIKRENVEIKRGDVLFLLAWNKKKLLTYSKTFNKLIVVNMCIFQMNLKRSAQLHGFPLQMGFSETAYSVQGQTVQEDIYISLSGCVKNEIYVMLSRSNCIDKIKGVIF